MRRLGRLLPLLLAILTAWCAPSLRAAAEERPVTSAELAELIRTADRAIVVFREDGKSDVQFDAVVEDRAWFDKVADVIHAGPMKAEAMCFCSSTPEMEIYHAGQPRLRLTLHHKSKIRLSGRFRGDYDVGGDRWKSILDLLGEHRANAKDRFLPPEKKTQPL